MEKIRSIKDKRFRSFLMSALRRISRFWQPARDALNKVKIARGLYQCKACNKVVQSKEIKIDHIEPVVPVEGFQTWDEVINRLFCDEEGFQAICKTCHDEKTKKENVQRRTLKKEKAVLGYYKKRRKKCEES